RGMPVRVFIVEDSPLIRKRIMDNLRSMGGFIVVGFAESEDDAVAAITETEPGVVVTDIRLKEGNGIAAVRQGRQASVASPPRICVLSTYATPESRHARDLAGADDSVDRPGAY